MPGWVEKHLKYKLFMIQSSSLKSERCRRLEIKDIKITWLNCIWDTFNLSLFISLVGHYQMLTGEHLRRASMWQDLPAIIFLASSSLWLTAFYQLYLYLMVRLERWNFPLCICPEDYLLLFNVWGLFWRYGDVQVENAVFWASQGWAAIEASFIVFPLLQLFNSPASSGITVAFTRNS